MRLLPIPDPFDHPDFLFEPKVDGFRALAFIDGAKCRLVSRNGFVFKGWSELASEIAEVAQCRSAVLDGEICCLDRQGRSNFYHLMFRRERPYFYAFDVLNADGDDLTALELLQRKKRLRAIIPHRASRLLYLDAVEQQGKRLYRLACKRDLEGIVAKWMRGIYQCDGRGTSWLNIKNPAYTQMDGRREFFEQRRPTSYPRRTARLRPELRLA